MQAVLPQPCGALRVRPAHAIDGTNRAINALHKKIMAEQAAADSPKAVSPKRKAIALDPGPAHPNQGRKRRKQADEGQQPAHQQPHPTQLILPANLPRQHQQQQQQLGPAKHGCSKAFLARFGIEQPDATVVDFLELQLGRITHAHEHSQDEDMSEVISLVAADICTAWQLQECPLECIIAQFVTSITTCAAAPPSHDPPPSPQHSDSGEQQSSSDDEDADAACLIEDKPLAKLWCSPLARQHHILTWLLHCASQLDGLFSSNPHCQAAAETAAAAAAVEDTVQPALDAAATPDVSQTPSDGPAKKKRGRPPGSKNKKTLQKLEAAGAPSSPPPAGASQQQQHKAVTGQATQGAPERFTQLDFLTALHKKVLQALGEACDPKRSGPFEAEVCCLSAAAASLCGLMGKAQVRLRRLGACPACCQEPAVHCQNKHAILLSLQLLHARALFKCVVSLQCTVSTSVSPSCCCLQPVTAQLVEALRSCELPARSKLQCAAAALEQNPHALTTSLPSAGQPAAARLSLMDLCCHAALHSLSEQQGFQESTLADAPAEQQTSAEAGELVTGVSGRTALAVQSWSQNKLTEIAASQLHALFCQQWVQLQQGNSERHDGALIEDYAPKAGRLWPAAEAAVLAQLHRLGNVTGTAGEKVVQPLWQDLQTALDIAVLHMGWEWAYYMVGAASCRHASHLYEPDITLLWPHVCSCLQGSTQICSASSWLLVA